MNKRVKLPKSDQLRIFFIGLGFMAMAYLLDSIIIASGKGESVYRQIFSPGSREIATSLLFLSILSLFIAYVLNLLLKHRRTAEALVKYQSGMDASVDGISILNKHYECVYVNNSYAKLYGYDSHTELIGKSWRLFYGDDEMKRFENEIFPAIREKETWRGEAVGWKQDGSEFPQEISLTMIDGHNIVCIVRDITDHKNFEAELERRARELSVANKELEAFSYSLTHDMRNYITRIYSAVQILQESEQSNSSFLVNIICDTCKDMEALVNDMLVLSRITRSEIRREKVDLGEMAHRIAVDLMLTEPERSVEFVIAPHLFAECDRHLLKIALENLLGNAWKYSLKVPQPRVEFGSVGHDAGKAFFIRDNGMGFDMHNADRLFKPFQRLENAKEFPGTGVGLATVQRVIQRHGGVVWGEGEVGKGATFFFTLPA
jgi:PAS domain S-box-containing protein